MLWRAELPRRNLVLDSPEGVCACQARFEYPATSVLFSSRTLSARNVIPMAGGVPAWSDAQGSTAAGRGLGLVWAEALPDSCAATSPPGDRNPGPPSAPPGPRPASK